MRYLVALVASIAIIAIVIGAVIDSYLQHLTIASCVESGGEWKQNPNVWAKRMECIKSNDGRHGQPKT